ncbi:transporter [Azospirillum argentinense]
MIRCRSNRCPRFPGGIYTGIPNSIHYWAVEPTLGVSWLHDGWNVSAALHYDINFKNTASEYTSGNILVGDYTVTKTIGKWTFTSHTRP